MPIVFGAEELVELPEESIDGNRLFEGCDVGLGSFFIIILVSVDSDVLHMERKNADKCSWEAGILGRVFTISILQGFGGAEISEESIRDTNLDAFLDLCQRAWRRREELGGRAGQGPLFLHVGEILVSVPQDLALQLLVDRLA